MDFPLRWLCTQILVILALKLEIHKEVYNGYQEKLSIPVLMI